MIRKHQAIRFGGLAALTASALSGVASAQTDTKIPLNYNFHLMAHAGEGQNGATALNADSPTNYYRAIADRGLYFDLTDPNCLGTLPIVGSTGGPVATGLTYGLFNTLGYSNSTLPGAATYGFDGVFIGNRGLNIAPELLINPDSNTGPFPAWAPAVTISSVTSAGTTVTATTSAPHGFTTGQVVLTGGIIPALLSGPYVVSATPSSTQFSFVDLTTTSSSAQMFANNIPVATMTFAAPTLTVVTSVAHGFAAGQQIDISGVLASGAQPQGYNGTYTVTAVNSLKEFTLTVSNGSTGTASARTYVNGALQATSIICDASRTATVTTAAAHGLTAGNSVTITGSNILPCNGIFTVASAADSTHFTYTYAPIGSMRANLIGLNSLSGNGTTVTATASAATYFTTGQNVTIQNVTPAGYNGTFPVTMATVNPTGIVSTTTTATVTTAAPHGFLTGQTIIVSGGSVANHNGKFNIASTPSATTFTYTITTQSGTSSAATIRNLNVFTYANSTTGSATGTFMGAGSLDRSQSPQVTTLSSPVLVDGNTQLGILYLASNGPSQFDATLTFNNGVTDTNVTARLVANDWFGLQSDPAVLAGQPVLFQKRVQHAKSAAISSLVGDGTNLVASIPTIQPFVVGDSVTISGASTPAHNGTFTITAVGGLSNTIATTAGAVAGIACDGTTAVVTTTAAHSFVAGSPVVITGAGQGLYNGVYTVLSSPAPTSTTFAFAHTFPGTSTGGAATLPSFTVANTTSGSSTGTMLAANASPTGTYFTYRGVANNEAANLVALNTTNAGPNLNLTEAIIAVPASVAGQNLTRITFGNAAWGTTAITAMSGTAGTVTATIGSTAGYIVGQAITIRGAVPAGFNGTYTIASIPSGTTLTFANATTGTATTTGTVERPGTGKGYSIYAVTARTGLANQANASCATPTVVTTTANVANVATDNLLSGVSAPVVTANDTTAVWFQYTAPASGNIPLLISTCTSAFDTTIAVYTSCGGSVVQSNDDTAGCGTGGSQVQFIATNNQTYLIRVAGKNGGKGTFTLHIEDAPTPANGSPFTPGVAISGVGTAGDTPGTVASAFDGFTTATGGGNDRYGVWYQYSPTGGVARQVEARTCLDGQDLTLTPEPLKTGVTGVRSVSQTNSAVVLPLDTTIAIYTGTAASPVFLAGNDNGCNVSSRVRWTATPGTIYFIRVASKAVASGNNAKFILHVDDPVHTDLTLPLQFNWNGINHGTAASAGPNFFSEQCVNLPQVHENRSDLNGFRSISDRGLLFDPNNTTQNAFNYGGTVGYQGMQYSVYDTPLQSDLVHLGTRTSAGFQPTTQTWADPVITTNPSNGYLPLWLPGNTATGVAAYDHSSATSSMTGLNATFGDETKLGLIYHMTNVSSTLGPASFNVTLTFNDGSSVVVSLQGTDWYAGSQDAAPYNQTLPAFFPSGVETHRVLGVYNAVQNFDRGDAAPNGSLRVCESVISTSSLTLAGFDPRGRGILTSINFSGVTSVNTTTNLAIFAATIRDPASFNLNFGPSGVGTVTPNQLGLGATGLMKVSVSRGSGSPNNITSVVVDGTAVGLANNFALNDSAQNGDPSANDNNWSRSVSFPLTAPAGATSLPFTITDAQSRTATGNIIFTITGPVTGANPNPVNNGSATLLTVALVPDNGGPNDPQSVSVNGSLIGLSSNIALNDIAAAGDLVNHDGTYSVSITVPPGTNGGTYALPYSFIDRSGRNGSGTINLTVIGPPAAQDLGVIATGASQFSGTLDNAGQVKWIKFTVSSEINAGLLTFLDIDTEGSTLFTPLSVLSDDVAIGIYDSTGNRVAFDDDDGSNFASQVSFGATTPARPAVGNGLNYDGRDGGLPVGTYYLAYVGADAAPTFGLTNWGVTATSTLTGGPVLINFKRGTVPGPGGPPAVFSNLGTMTVGGAGTTNSATAAVSSGGVAWFKFVVPAPGIDGGVPTLSFLDIDTETSALSDTLVALFRDDGSGTLVVTDNDDGSGAYSQLTYGRGNRPAVGDGAIYNGRDGATLAAGTYYLAVTESNAAFGNGFVVAFNTGASAGNVTVNIRAGVQSPIVNGPLVNPDNNHTYYLLTNGFNWQQAEDYAVSQLGGHLAQIEDASENNFIAFNVIPFDGFNHDAFIGLWDPSLSTVIPANPAADTRPWAWTTGQPFGGFLNWNVGEPNNGPGAAIPGQEHYGMMFSGTGFWNDINISGAAGSTIYAVIEVGGGGVCCRGSTCNTTITQANCTVTGGSAGAFFSNTGSTCNSGPISSTPCCYADYDKMGGLAVGDIFAFLNDWFASSPYANVGGNGDSGALNVQNIFDFLSDWFTGCN